MNIEKIEYKDFDIRYDEDDNTWRCYELSKSYESLKKAKEAIDRRIRESSKIVPFTAYIVKREYSYDCNTYKLITVTSITAKGEIWATIAKERFKYTGTVYKDTPQNEELIKQICALNSDIKKLENDRFNLTSDLSEINIKSLLSNNTEETKGEKND
ncbi:MAG: hypothetical protein FWB73_00080 [Treponema sp.]|nr:hypothetical protein [Treponema sp.]